MNGSRWTLLVFLLLCLVTLPHAAQAQQSSAETFDVSGLPAQPASMLEQQIWDLYRHHPAGNLRDALELQRKLAQYYEQAGDAGRARVAAERAHDAEAQINGVSSAPGAPAHTPAATPASSTTPAKGNAHEDACAASATPVRGAFNGRYFAMTGPATQMQWTFNSDGTFYATTISGRSGTSVRTGERGTYRVDGAWMTLRVCSEATGFATGGVGGRSDVIGGGASAAVSSRRVAWKRLGARPEDGIVLDGHTYKWRSW